MFGGGGGEWPGGGKCPVTVAIYMVRAWSVAETSSIHANLVTPPRRAALRCAALRRARLRPETKTGRVSSSPMSKVAEQSECRDEITANDRL